MLARQESSTQGQERGRTVSGRTRHAQGSGRRRDAVRVVVLDDRGQVIGKVLAPTGRDLFGPGRATVYLTRR